MLRLRSGFPNGFPVLLENALPYARAVQTVQMLIDGNYVDKAVSPSPQLQEPAPSSCVTDMIRATTR